jgi:hypothetical protein
VIERFAAAPRGLDEDAQVVDDALLPDVVGESARPQRGFGFAIVDRRARGEDFAIGHVRA